MSEDVAGTVALMRGTNRKCDDSGGYEDEVHGDEDGLELSHDFGHDGGENGVAKDTGDKGSVDCSARWCPVSVSGDHDDGQKHQGEAIYFAVKIRFEGGGPS